MTFRGRLTVPGAATLVALGGCIALMFWEAESASPWDSDLRGPWHQYEYLAQGFLSGHTYLSVGPPAALLHLRDPYDPAANAPYRIWDASLYRGRYYLYQGPVPALVLMAPWQLVTGHPLPQRMAVAIFASAGLAGLALLLKGVRDRQFPSLSAPRFGAVLCVAFVASWLPVLLRRSALWELPVVSATACLWWALYFLWRFHVSGGRIRWAASVGISLALVMGCRASSVFSCTAVALLLFVQPGGNTPLAGQRWRAALVGAALATAGGCALLAYNYVRFGSWFEFGLNYALFGEDYRGIRFSRAAFIPFNFWVYLRSAPQFGPYFPFLHPFWTDFPPEGYVAFEEAYGIGLMMPVHLAAAAAFGWVWTRRSRADARAEVVTVAAGAGASLLAAAVLFTWAWACSRYINELAAGWTVATAVGLMAIFAPEGLRPSKAMRILTVVAACWTMACVGLASAEFRGFMRQVNPRTYSALAHTLDYPSLWWARAHQVPFGPLALTIRIPAGSGAVPVALLASGRPQSSNRLLIKAQADGRAVLMLTDNDHVVLETPALPVKGGELVVRLDVPWLYPPPDHPYWDGIADPVRRRDLQTLFAVTAAGGSTAVHSLRSNDAVGFEPVARTSLSGTDSPYVESMAFDAPGAGGLAGAK